MRRNLAIGAALLLTAALMALSVLRPASAAGNAAAAAPAQTAAQQQGSLLPRDSVEAAVFRGGLVYANYCVTCHGMNADGNGRAARLYTPRPANLRQSDKNDQYVSLIIRKGGAPLGRSEFMPTWEAELTDEQVRDLVAYLRSINVTKAR